MRFADASLAASIMISSSIRCWSTGGELVWTMKRSAPRIDSSNRQYVSPLAKVRRDTSPTWIPSFSAIRCASSGCERPAKSMSRFDGPVSIQCSGLSSGLVSATSSPGRRVSSVVALSTEVALFRDLLRREPSKRFGRDIFCYVRPARNPCIVSDLDRGLEAIVNPGPDVAADLRPLLRAARLVGEVGRDVPGSDVRVLADLGVADVGEVRHLRPGAELRVLDLHERARSGTGGELRAGAEVTERPGFGVRADLGVDDDCVRADLSSGSDAGLPAQHREGMDRRVRLELDLRVDPRRLRIDDRHAREHVVVVHA